MFSEIRRFIAGARCPACDAEDRIVVYHRDGLDHRECVACAWFERATQGGGPPPEAEIGAPVDAVRWTILPTTEGRD